MAEEPFYSPFVKPAPARAPQSWRTPMDPHARILTALLTRLALTEQRPAALMENTHRNYETLYLGRGLRVRVARSRSTTSVAAKLVVLQKGPDRARRLGDVGEQLGQRVAHRQGLAAPFLGRQHIVDERAAMQNALLLAPKRVDLRERRGVRAGCRGSWVSRSRCGDRRCGWGDAPSPLNDFFSNPCVLVRTLGCIPCRRTAGRGDAGAYSTGVRHARLREPRDRRLAFLSRTATTGGLGKTRPRHLEHLWATQRGQEIGGRPSG